jgi:hypothetical protein
MFVKKLNSFVNNYKLNIYIYNYGTKHFRLGNPI